MSKGGKTVIILLIVLNIITLVFMWWSKRPFSEPKEPPRPEEYMRKRLELSGEQQEKLGQIRRAYFDRIHHKERALQEVRNDLFDAQTIDPDSAKVMQDLQQIGLLQQSIDSLTYAHFVAIGAICSPEQAKHLKNMLREMTQRRFGNGEHPRGGRGPEGPDK